MPSCRRGVTHQDAMVQMKLLCHSKSPLDGNWRLMKRLNFRFVGDEARNWKAVRARKNGRYDYTQSAPAVCGFMFSRVRPVAQQWHCRVVRRSLLCRFTRVLSAGSTVHSPTKRRRSGKGRHAHEAVLACVSKMGRNEVPRRLQSFTGLLSMLPAAAGCGHTFTRQRPIVLLCS